MTNAEIGNWERVAFKLTMRVELNSNAASESTRIRFGGKKGYFELLSTKFKNIQVRCYNFIFKLNKKVIYATMQ